MQGLQALKFSASSVCPKTQMLTGYNAQHAKSGIILKNVLMYLHVILSQREIGFATYVNVCAL